MEARWLVGSVGGMIQPRVLSTGEVIIEGTLPQEIADKIADGLVGGYSIDEGEDNEQVEAPTESGTDVP